MNPKEILDAYKTGKLSKAGVQEKLRELEQQSIKSPLSEGQKGLWLLQKMSPDMSAYNVPLCLRFSQELDKQKLEQAVSLLLEQYPILSSKLEEDNGVPYLTYQPSQTLDLRQEDLSALEDSEVLPCLREKAKEPFLFESGPLMRINLFFRSEHENIMLITIHHIIFDGISSQIIITKLLKTYQDLIENRNPVTRLSSTSYNDFVVWEQKMLESKEGAEHRSYWKQQLAGTLPTLELPTDRPRFSAQIYKGKTHTKLLSPVLTKGVRDFAQSQQVNLSMVFLGLFKLLLHRYTGQEDIIVGMPAMGRPQERFDSLIGYFINMIPIRSQVAGTQSFAKLIQELQLTLTDALDHATYPFPMLVRELNVPRTPMSPPVFQVAFLYQNFFQSTDLKSIQDEYQSTLSIEFIDEIQQEGEYEFQLEVFKNVDEFILNMKYNPELFDPATITRMMGHYVHLIEEVINCPTLALGEYSLISDQERDTILIDWNATQADYPKDKCIHELFEEQVRKTPNATAVIYEEESLTYRELDERSTGIAVYLQQQGVTPDALVGICVKRSLEMIVGLLGILKAGGAYVPLDPDYPTERLDYMVRDSKVSIILTQSGLMDKLSELIGEGVKAIVFDELWAEIEHKAIGEKTLKREVRPNHLAYVIYTSGSTGKPKGVMIPHQALTNFLITMKDKPGLSAQDKLLAVTTYSFDIAGLELFLPLIIGAQCNICSTEKTKDAEKLKLEIQKLKPTIMQATPVTWTMLFQIGWKNEERMKILCGGEALPERLKQFFINTNSDVWNMFGPTETTIWSTVQHIREEEPITIGKPIANTNIYILDKNLRLTPIGVPGELCIAGDGLAVGYLNKPSLTAEIFIDNPFNLGTKLYKGGDLARWLPNGNIEFLGRTDHQVKIHGYRIELGEIESQLNSYPNIRNSIAVVKEQEGVKQLIAYVLKEHGQHLNLQELRDHLKRNLPHYMIPAVFVELESIPLTPSGKIDREELMNRPQSMQSVLTGVEYVAPRDEVEEKLADICKGILILEKIGVNDNLFDIGVNSLTTLKIQQKIENIYPGKIKIPDLIQYTTISSLASAIKSKKGEELESPGSPGSSERSEQLNILLSAIIS